jgi:uncharacterized spore protein YtfJ
MTEPSDVQRMITEGFERIGGTFSASEVFSAHEAGERLVITAQSVEVGGGFGFGTGSDSAGNLGGGGGGGGGGKGRPVAVIEVGPAGVEIHPVIDFTRLGVAVLGTLLALWRAAGRRRRS